MRPSDHERGCQGREYTCTCGYDAARDEEIERLKGERDETVGWIGTVECPCTTFEQDETCPVGYPSLLCGACGGKGVVRAETVIALAAEMLKIAEQVDELEDPFAAWESIELLKSASLSDLSVSGEAARIGDAVLSWLVKFDLADAGNEYRAEDVVNILNELAPVSQLQSDRSVSGDAVRVAALAMAECFKETITASAGKPFDETGVTLPSMEVFERYARSALVTADRTEDGRDELAVDKFTDGAVREASRYAHKAGQTEGNPAHMELIRELVRALKQCAGHIDNYYFEGDKEYEVVIIARSALTLASEAGYNDGGEK